MSNDNFTDVSNYGKNGMIIVSVRAKSITMEADERQQPPPVGSACRCSSSRSRKLRVLTDRRSCSDQDVSQVLRARSKSASCPFIGF